MAGSTPRKRSKLLLKLGAVAILGGIVVVLLLRGVDVRGFIASLMAATREMGPWAFFGGMALLPAVGFPVMAFALTAGPAFAPQLGLPGVLLASAGAIIVNILLTYWLARYAFRPVLKRWLSRLGYSIPVVEKEDQMELTILVRITPGPPFFVQSYLLGLAQIPFRTYILPSFIFPMVNISGVVIFGDALAQGKLKWALLGLSLVVAAGLAVQVLRRHYAKRKKSAVDSHGTE